MYAAACALLFPGATTRIVFTNGLLDPWHGGGVMEDVTRELPALVIPEGAHHLDLMFAHKDDPRSVVRTRREIKYLVEKWIRYARQEQEFLYTIVGSGKEGVAEKRADTLLWEVAGRKSMAGHESATQ